MSLSDSSPERTTQSTIAFPSLSKNGQTYMTSESLVGVKGAESVTGAEGRWAVRTSLRFSARQVALLEE